MFHLTDPDSAPPNTANWPWGKWVAALCGSAAVFFAIMVLHDERLEPYEDLRRQAAAEPPKEKNGFLLLYSRWEGLPEASHMHWKLAENILAGTAPWDPAHLEAMRSGRESLQADLEEALSLPEWMDPWEIGPEGYPLRSQSVLLQPLLLVRLEVMRDLTEGRDEEAFAGIERLHRLATRQLEGSGNINSYLVALSSLATVMEPLATFVEKSKDDPGTLQKLARWWEQDPPIIEGFNRAMAGEAIFLERLIPTLKWNIRSGYSSSFKGYLASLFLKKNKTQNLMNRKIRKLIAVAMVPYPDRAAAEAAGAAEGPAVSPIIPAWRNLNFAGNQLVDNTGYHNIISGILRQLFNARALRVKIALHQWQADHGPGLPATLEELVPDYLAKIPADPWNGQPLLWDQASGVIHAVGSNWLPDLPSAGQFKNKWLSGEHTAPGLRFVRPPLPAPSAPATAPAATGTN